jgi:hypothetical protein
MKKRILALLSAAAVMVVMLAGALAFTPKVAKADPTWCYQSGTEIAVTTLCTLPALGESNKETRARCEEARASDPNAISSKCKPDDPAI